MTDQGHRSYRIMMIEDDPDLCQGWVDLFDLLGHHLQCHRRGRDALENREAIRDSDLLITDYYLPDLNGVEVITRARQLRPDLPVILLTGSREASVVDSARRLSHCSILFKPISIEDLEVEIERVLANPRRV